VLSQAADPIIDQLVPQEIQDRITDTLLPVTSQGQQPAPACKKQGPFTFGGETTQFPKVKAQP
jgi:hypothetical protein